MNYGTTLAINGNNNNNSPDNRVPTTAIVGGGVGAVGAVLLLGLLFVLFRRRIRGRGRSRKPAPDDFSPQFRLITPLLGHPCSRNMSHQNPPPIPVLPRALLFHTTGIHHGRSMHHTSPPLGRQPHRGARIVMHHDILRIEHKFCRTSRGGE